MKRTITEKLNEWKYKEDRKPLILTGVRQCGKTFILKEFGSEAFQYTAYFNFEEMSELAGVFEYNLDTDRILDELRIFQPQIPIVPGSTLVIFDEIQACPKAITSLKYFAENMPELHVIAAASLLGVALKKQEVSFPVGKVDQLVMYPMNFSEFAYACGAERYFKGIRNRQMEDALPDLYTVPLEKLLKQYFVIGGMPEAVQNWINHHNYELIDDIQKNILAGYRNDFAKHAPADIIPRLTAVWDAIPGQLARENNKFFFSRVRNGLRAKDLEDALQWLTDAGLIIKPELVETPYSPVSAMADAVYFKVYLCDVGLMRQMAGLYYKTLTDGFDSYTPFKGSLTENYIFTELVSSGFPVWFWRSGNTAEIDALTEFHGKVIPFEVKNAENTHAKSYKVYCEKYHPEIGFKISLKNIGINMICSTKTISLPLYLTGRLKEYIDAFTE